MITMVSTMIMKLPLSHDHPFVVRQTATGIAHSTRARVKPFWENKIMTDDERGEIPFMCFSEAGEGNKTHHRATQNGMHSSYKEDIQLTELNIR